MTAKLYLKILTISLLFLLTNCAAPLVGSILPGSALTVAQGKYAQTIFNTGLQTIVHEKTGKTVNEHIFDVN